MLTKQPSKGFTLLEVLFCVSIAGILVALAVPSFRATQERNEIIAVVEALSGDLRWTRSEALKRSDNMIVKFTPGDGGVWLYSVATQSAPTVPVKSVISAQNTQFGSVVMTEDFCNNETVFEHISGTIAGISGNVTLTSSQGTYSLRVMLSSMGNVSICSDNIEIGDYDACLTYVAPVCP